RRQVRHLGRGRRTLARLAWCLPRGLPRVGGETAVSSPSGCPPTGSRAQQGSTGMPSQQRTRSRPMQRARVNGTDLEYVVQGTGGPVVLVHGALIAEAYAPLCAEPALAAGYQLVRNHRRGYAASARAAAPFGIAQRAADCLALLRYLGLARAH